VHRAEDLICLCANCHERADKEKWGERTLREYKRRPWILRRYEDSGGVLKAVATVKVVIEVDLDNAHPRVWRLLPYAIAGLLEIPPDAIRIGKTICSQKMRGHRCSLDVL
jgi:type I restriction enzyme R subunit